MKCAKCGAEDWMLVERVGSLETWRCKTCGAEELVHSHYGDPPASIKGFAPCPDVFLRWNAKPSAAQIAELQDIFPRLKKLSSVELLKLIRSGSEIPAGKFREAELAPMRARLDALGVVVEFRLA